MESINTNTNKTDTETNAGKNALTILFFAVMLDLIGFGLIFPILPFWTTCFVLTI